MLHLVRDNMDSLLLSDGFATYEHASKGGHVQCPVGTSMEANQSRIVRRGDPVPNHGSHGHISGTGFPARAVVQHFGRSQCVGRPPGGATPRNAWQTHCDNLAVGCGTVL